MGWTDLAEGYTCVKIYITVHVDGGYRNQLPGRLDAPSIP